MPERKDVINYAKEIAASLGLSGIEYLKKHSCTTPQDLPKLWKLIVQEMRACQKSASPNLDTQVLLDEMAEVDDSLLSDIGDDASASLPGSAAVDKTVIAKLPPAKDSAPKVEFKGIFGKRKFSPKGDDAMDVESEPAAGKPPTPGQDGLNLLAALGHKD